MVRDVRNIINCMGYFEKGTEEAIRYSAKRSRAQHATEQEVEKK